MFFGRKVLIGIHFFLPDAGRVSDLNSKKEDIGVTPPVEKRTDACIRHWEVGAGQGRAGGAGCRAL